MLKSLFYFILLIGSSIALMEYSGQLICGAKPAGGNIVELWMEADKACSDSQLDEVVTDPRGNYLLGDEGQQSHRKRYILVKHACESAQSQEGLRVSQYDVHPFIPQAINLVTETSNERRIRLS
ncbi:unnamed protein product [Auanema sp. JU1783]|nr:unnamed protein product [Auanema sp. JU1783]